MEPNRAQPILLAPAPFTSPLRTPWGGRRILTLKQDVPLSEEARAQAVVGESWELSMTSEFPSRDATTGRSLAAIVEEDPFAFLGAEALAGRKGTALLVKLLDAAEPLSVQIHPDDAFSDLAPSESGKPECWYVIERAPGSGLYFGLREGATREAMKEALEKGEGVEALLQFVPVEPGDFFVVHPGTPHAVGQGVTLVEPQLVAPGKKGVTYRYFDWNRRYDAAGRLSVTGSPRTLHIEQALAVTRWDAPRAEEFLRQTRHRGGQAEVDGGARCDVLSVPLVRSEMNVLRLSGRGAIQLPRATTLQALTVLAGDVTVEGPAGPLRVSRGRTAVLPPSLGEASLRLEGAHAVVASVRAP